MPLPLKPPLKSRYKKLSFNQICLGLITASFMMIAIVQSGVIKPAHAVSVNVAVRLLKEAMAESEARIIKEVKASCEKTD